MKPVTKPRAVTPKRNNLDRDLLDELTLLLHDIVTDELKVEDWSISDDNGWITLEIKH